MAKLPSMTNISEVLVCAALLLTLPRTNQNHACVLSLTWKQGVMWAAWFRSSVDMVATNTFATFGEKGEISGVLAKGKVPHSHKTRLQSQPYLVSFLRRQFQMVLRTATMEKYEGLHGGVMYGLRFHVSRNSGDSKFWRSETLLCLDMWAAQTHRQSRVKEQRLHNFIFVASSNSVVRISPISHTVTDKRHSLTRMCLLWLCWPGLFEASLPFSEETQESAALGVRRKPITTSCLRLSNNGYIGEPWLPLVMFTKTTQQIDIVICMGDSWIQTQNKNKEVHGAWQEVGLDSSLSPKRPLIYWPPGIPLTLAWRTWILIHNWRLVGDRFREQMI